MVLPQTQVHEYAYYMDHMLTEGNFCDEDYDAHGEKWQAYCEFVGQYELADNQPAVQ